MKEWPFPLKYHIKKKCFRYQLFVGNFLFGIGSFLYYWDWLSAVEDCFLRRRLYFNLCLRLFFSGFTSLNLNQSYISFPLWRTSSFATASLIKVLPLLTRTNITSPYNPWLRFLIREASSAMYNFCQIYALF